MTRVHVVGSGGYAQTLSTEVELIAGEGVCRLGSVVIDRRFVADGEWETLAATRRSAGWTVRESFDELVERDGPTPGRRDLLVLPVPIALHEPMVVRGLRAGFDVMCEKPAAGSLAEIASMAAAEAASSGRLLFGYQHPLSASLGGMVERVAAGEIGTVSSIRGWVLWPRRQSYYRRNSWAGRLAAGGRAILDSPIQNATAHFLHAGIEIAYRAGYLPDRLTAEHARIYDIETADLQALRVVTRSLDEGRGAGRQSSAPSLFYLAAHSCAERFDPKIVVEGSDGAFRWSLPARLEMRRGREPWTTIRNDTTDVRFTGLPIRGALESNGTVGTGIESAARHTAVVVAAFGGEGAPGFPIAALDAAYWREVSLPDDSQRAVIGLEEVARRAAASQRLPSELDVPWGAGIHRVEGPVRYASLA